VVDFVDPDIEAKLAALEEEEEVREGGREGGREGWVCLRFGRGRTWWTLWTRTSRPSWRPWRRRRRRGEGGREGGREGGTGTCGRRIAQSIHFPPSPTLQAWEREHGADMEESWELDEEGKCSNISLLSPSFPPSLSLATISSLPLSLPPSLPPFACFFLAESTLLEAIRAKKKSMREAHHLKKSKNRYEAKDGGRAGGRKGYGASVSFLSLHHLPPPSLPPSLLPLVPSCPAVADSTPQKRSRLTWRAWGYRRRASGSEAVLARRLARRRGAGRRG
jgi:hypothetical protein